MVRNMKIGILALQGAFAEHEKILDRLQTEYFEIRQRKDIDQDFDALIIPGGESTVISKLLQELELLEPLKKRIMEGMPVWGTCAGLILLAARVEGGTPAFGTMDITAKRNAYGRQLGSFVCTECFEEIGEIPMTFIRAPYIAEAGEDVKVLASVNGRIVAARQRNQLVTAFHLEVTKDTRVHEYFVQMIEKDGLQLQNSI